MTTSDRVSQLWDAALADVALDVPVKLMIFEAARRQHDAPWACHVEPNCNAWEAQGHLFSFLPEHQEQALRDVAFHQVLVHDGVADEVLLGLMRHELEHARQLRQSLWIARANSGLNRAAERVFEELPQAFRGLYPWLPGERDASAAATRLVVSVFGVDIVARYARTPHGSLLGTQSRSGPYETLPQRLIGTAALWPEEFDDALNDLFGFSTEPQRAAAELADALLGANGRIIYGACMLDSQVGEAREWLTDEVLRRAVRPAAGSTWDSWRSVRKLLDAAGAAGERLAAEHGTGDAPVRSDPNPAPAEP